MEVDRHAQPQDGTMASMENQETEAESSSIPVDQALPTPMTPMEALTFHNFSEVPENATRADIDRIMNEGKTEKETVDDVDTDGTTKSQETHKKSRSRPPSSSPPIKSSIFPAKLYKILANPRYNEIIRWLPHGRAWEVLDRNAFIKHVAPAFFSFSKYSSFSRQVTGWCFRRVSSGPDRNAYYHELFMRGKPHLIKFMKREVAYLLKRDESTYEDPNFYELSKKYPLPALPGAPPQHVLECSQLSTSASGNSRGHLAPPPMAGHLQMYPYLPAPINHESYQEYNQVMPPPAHPQPSPYVQPPQPPPYAQPPPQLQYCAQHGQQHGQHQSQYGYGQNLLPYNLHNLPPRHQPTIGGRIDGGFPNDGQRVEYSPQPKDPSLNGANLPMTPLMTPAENGTLDQRTDVDTVVL